MHKQQRSQEAAWAGYQGAWHGGSALDPGSLARPPWAHLGSLGIVECPPSQLEVPPFRALERAVLFGQHALLEDGL